MRNGWRYEREFLVCLWVVQLKLRLPMELCPIGIKRCPIIHSMTPIFYWMTRITTQFVNSICFFFLSSGLWLWKFFFFFFPSFFPKDYCITNVDGIIIWTPIEICNSPQLYYYIYAFEEKKKKKKREKCCICVFSVYNSTWSSIKFANKMKSVM